MTRSLVRMSPAHPLWHARPLTEPRYTVCGRPFGERAVIEPWRGVMPAQVCSRCAPYLAGLPAEEPAQ